MLTTPTPAASGGAKWVGVFRRIIRGMAQTILSSPPSPESQLAAASGLFRERFGHAATHGASAPGRVNLIGEHTDYNDGFVLPMAIERRTVVVAARRPEGLDVEPGDVDAIGPATARVVSQGVEGAAIFGVTDDLKPGAPKWGNYIRGVVAGMMDEGIDVGGFDMAIVSSVDRGGGLSSSAALEVAAATALEAVTGTRLDPVRKALICQQAEHEFAGVPCGIMDQFISTMGKKGHALLIDCLSHEATPVPMNDEDVVVLVVNTHVEHELSGGEYAQRRQACAYVSKELSVQSLRYVDMDMLNAARASLDDVEYQRARHVISENERTLAAAEAMRRGDWRRMGELMFESHASLRDDYQVSCDELDVLVSLAEERRGAGGVYGSRMTGGGFGGCTVTLLRADAAEDIAKHMVEGYRERTGIAASAFVTRAASGSEEWATDAHG